MASWRHRTTTPPAAPAPEPEPVARRALSAAVASVGLDGTAWRTYRFGDRSWQADAWRLYDITGQLRFVGNWLGNSLSRCRLYVAEVGEDGEAGNEATNPDIANLASGPLGSGPAKDESLRLLGINLFVPGEAFIVAESDGVATGVDRWFVVSGRQIKREGDRITIKRSQLHGGGVMEYRQGVDLILRVWTPHPADTDEPDSPTRSAIPDLREIEANRKRVFAELDSRLSGAGLLGLPDGIDFPRGDDDPPGAAGFMAYLMRAMGTSLRDRSSAEAMVPIMFTAPAEALDKIRHITFWSELSDQLLPLREAAVRSLAQSLDVPPEVLLGLGGTNHWSAWAISEEAVTTQVVPVLSRIADALTQGYLRAALTDLGQDPERYVYHFDTAPLTTRPNRSADALNYHERGLISDTSARDAGAFSDEDTPTDEERVRRLFERAAVTQPSLLADPSVREILGITTVTALPAGESGQPPPPPGEQPQDNSPPQPTPQTEDGGPGGRAAALIAVSKLSVLRALALAGGRLVPHRQRDRWQNTARYQLHSRHGPITRDEADNILRGAWDDLPAVAGELMVTPGQLQFLLHEFCAELLTRGLAYDPALLTDLLRRAALSPAPAAVSSR